MASALGLLVAMVSLLLYGQVGWHSFINYDDHQYAIDNVHVTTGLTAANLLWAFQTGYAANWHPVTWLSHMLDHELFGLNPGPQHLVNALLHVMTSALLSLALFRLTGLPWRSVVVAALFAFHPVHVESVAWISERKDLLCAFFWMLTMLAYQRYAASRTWQRYSLVALFLALGLMAKPMAVTLPCVLLLLDYWPLNGLRSSSQFWRLLVEKMPLLALSIAASVVTVLVQKSGGAVASMEQTPIHARLGGALLTYFFYLGKTFWPVELFIPYWYEFKAGFFTMALAIAGFIILTCGALVLGKRHKYLPVGWLWYLGTLVPVIGLVQVGSQSAADRYMYLPSIGIFILATWSVAELSLYWRVPRLVIAAATTGILATCALLTVRQLGYWKNSETLFQHTLEMDPPNLVAINLLAWTYATDLDPKLRDGGKAVQMAAFCVNVTEGREPVFLKALAAAYAEAHEFPLAVETAEAAIRLATARGQSQLAMDIQANMEHYRIGRAIREK